MTTDLSALSLVGAFFAALPCGIENFFSGLALLLGADAWTYLALPSYIDLEKFEVLATLLVRDDSRSSSVIILGCAFF